MEIVVWIIIILVVIFLIWLLKRWIRRIIFILILLALAFLIYGIFNPSGAARLWYNVRTFPERMAGWMGSGKEFLDYDTYKSKISSIGDSIGDKIDSIGDDIDLSIDNGDDDLDNGEGDIDYNEKDKEGEIGNVSSDDDEKIIKNTGKNVIKSFPKIIRFVKIPELKGKTEHENVGVLSGYSRTDLLGVINRYLERNLDDDTDILVTVEYDEDSADPQKIILQTQSKNDHSIINSHNLMNEIFPDSDRKVPDEIEVIPAESNNLELEESKSNKNSESVQKQVQTSKKTTSTKLTQKEQKEAEEIFGILF